MDIGKMTITEGLKHLQPIADEYGLNLNKLNEFRFARLLFVNLYLHELV